MKLGVVILVMLSTVELPLSLAGSSVSDGAAGAVVSVGASGAFNSFPGPTGAVQGACGPRVYNDWATTRTILNRVVHEVVKNFFKT
jgi:hypothetical protein